MSGKKIVISILKRKKRKKIRNGKRVRKKKKFVLDVLQVTMAGI